MNASELLRAMRERGVSVVIKPSEDKLVVRGRVTEEELAAIRRYKAEIIDQLRHQPMWLPPAVRALVGMDDAEIDQMAERIRRTQEAGYSYDDASQIADHLLLRDRTRLDMGMCLECRHLSGRYCLSATSIGAVAEWQPIRHVLQRCPAFQKFY